MNTPDSPPRADLALGRQMTIEFYDCDPAVLADAPAMERIFLKAAADSGATILDSRFHGFEPQGVSGVVIIAESHFTVHAWPEHDYAAVDIFTCGEHIDFEKGVESLRQSLRSGSVIVSSVMNRGIVSNNGMERLVPVCEDHTHRYALSWKTRFESTAAWGIMISIDVYNASPRITGSAAAIEAFAADFAGQLSCRFAGDAGVAEFSEPNGTSGFTLVCCDGASFFCGRFVRETNTAYLDISCPAFVDPRPAAELAIRLLGGTHYRMQVAIRQ